VLFVWQGEVCLEITKVLSEIEDDISGLPELLSHTQIQGQRHQSTIPDRNEPMAIGTPNSSHDDDGEEEDEREGDSDTTVEVNSVATTQSHSGDPESGNRSVPTSAKPIKGIPVKRNILSCQCIG